MNTIGPVWSQMETILNSYLRHGLMLIPIAAGVWAINLYILSPRAFARIGYLPGHVSFIPLSSIFSRLLPNVKYFNERPPSWQAKYDVFKENNCDIISSMNIYPTPLIGLLIADPNVIKEITLNRISFPKPVAIYKALKIYGDNIIATEHDEWKRHRKVGAPAFGERNNSMVHRETTRIVLNLFDAWKSDGMGDVVTVSNMADVTFELALQVIAAAGFGYNVAWKDDGSLPAGHTMSFKHALQVAIVNIIWRVILPDWALGLYKKGKEIRESFKELGVYMQEMIESRKEALEQGLEQSDLFTSLLRASAMGDKGSLTDQEVMGNMFVYILAGHETTAHTLGFALGLLALYPDCQERVLQEVRSSVTEGNVPTYEDVCRMKYTLGVLYESLRLYPAVGGIPKLSERDTVFRTTDNVGNDVNVPVPAGTSLTLSAVGLHYNPKHWPDPHAFKPERFLGDWNKDCFIPFSAGARACLGRRFFEIESLTTLALLVLHYRIEVLEEPQFVHETLEQRRERVLEAQDSILTLTPTCVPLQLIRRK